LPLCFIFRSFHFGYAPCNGTRFSRREASAASEAVGWKPMLGGIPSNVFRC